MKICLILEGCYPYVRGGVSTWTDNYIRSFPGYEFILWTIFADRSQSGKFKYTLPENVSAVHEVFLNDAFSAADSGGRKKFSKEELIALSKLVRCEDLDWELLFRIFMGGTVNPQAFLRSETFMDLLNELCSSQYVYAPFSEVFYTVRSMVLPLLHVLTQKPPEADVYHPVATGYCGILGALGAYTYDKPLIITEHGIYTREREEEILRSKWTVPNLKDMWIQFFNMLSLCAYKYAVFVTSLYGYASEVQINLGCPPEKTHIINNGINFGRFTGIQPKEPDGWIDIGAVVRIAPIKDIKTMIYAFSELKVSVGNARLHILGDVDDKDYDRECHELVDYLKIKDVIFVGNTDVSEYIKKLDFTILTSISESQPLAILESLAAARPVVSTDVGSCRELLEGFGEDDPGVCGFICPPMDPGALAQAMKRMCLSGERRKRMGETGRERVRRSYQQEIMLSKYNELYLKVEAEAVHGRNRV
ncbi:MAG: GT4 family glycosyltransferase PelF [Treponema sp.]|nr:GT4 family glycosyltransferase PelF [Treponema sp.]